MQAKLVEVFEIAPDVKHFVFETLEGEPFPFLPGQFVSVSELVNGKQITRAYSIASAPNGNRFELCLNRVNDGVFSPYMFELKSGDAVDIRPPLGYFTLRTPPSDVILIATGTGIAPYRSMLLTELAKHERRFTLVFGIRHEPSIMYRGEFELMERDHPEHLRFWPTLSRPDPSWKGRTGHVQKHLDEAIGDRRDVDIYLCGLKLMVDDVRSRLKELGFDRKRIIYEKYD